MLRNVKPRNARSKRALEAREPKGIEDARTAIFVRGTSAGELVNKAMKELMALKRPNAISFSKKNTVRPFEDVSSLEFWARKNDASLFVIGQSTKKRPDGLTFVRMFDHRVLDMCEVGIDHFKSMEEFKTKKTPPGNRPLMHFASELFDSHPRYIQLKSLLLDFFASQVLDGIHLAGVEHVISVSVAPPPPDLNLAFDANIGTTLAAAAAGGGGTGGGTEGGIKKKDEEDMNKLPKVYLRTYTIAAAFASGASGTANTTTTSSTALPQPRIELTPTGPSLDLTLRRSLPTSSNPDLLKSAMRRRLPQKQQDVTEKTEKTEKKRKLERKNVEVDAMGDVRGRIHLGRQDLGRMQVKKVRGLRGHELGEDDEGEDEGEEEPRRELDAMEEEDEKSGGESNSEGEEEQEERSAKRRKAA